MAKAWRQGRKELRRSLRACRLHIVAVAGFSVFANRLMLTGPLFMLQVYDRVLASRSEETLAFLLLLVTGLFFLYGLLEFIRGRVLARAGARFQSLLDLRVFDAVLRRSVVPVERALPNSAARDLESIRMLLAGPALQGLGIPLLARQMAEAAAARLPVKQQRNPEPALEKSGRPKPSQAQPTVVAAAE